MHRATNRSRRKSFAQPERSKQRSVVLQTQRGARCKKISNQNLRLKFTQIKGFYNSNARNNRADKGSEKNNCLPAQEIFRKSLTWFILLCGMNHVRRVAENFTSK